MSTSVVRSMGRSTRVLPLCVFVLLLCAIPVTAFAEEEQIVASLRQMGKAFTAIAEKSSPAVVGVRAVKTDRSGSRSGSMEQDGLSEEDLFEYFFRRRMPRQYRQEQPKQVVEGSGFVVSSDGYILTNNHLVGETEEVHVQLDDRRSVKARVIGADPETDVAVIKIDATDLPYVEMGDSDALEVGEWVIAIGNPFGLSHTVTAGIVSAKGRTRIGVADFEDFIQTDAAINFGNSGGPLLNLDGKAVGINTAIIGPGGNIGIGLAIPMNMARMVYEQLKDSGKVVRGYIGVEIVDIDAGVGEFYGAANDQGAMVMKVREDSPAAKAGIKVDDIVVELEGESVAGATELINKIAARKPGANVEVVVLRDGKRKKVTVTLGARPDSVELASGGESKTEEQVGLYVQTLTRELAERLGYEDLSGVVVIEVGAGSPADDQEIQPGDLITEVNRQPIRNLKQWNSALANAVEKGKLLLRIRNEDGTRLVLIPLSEE